MADEGTRSMETLAKRCRRMAATGRVGFLHAEPSEKASLLSTFSIADNAALTARHDNQGLAFSSEPGTAATPSALPRL